MDRNPWQTLLLTASLHYKAGIPALALDLAHDEGKRALVYGELDGKTLAALASEHVAVTVSSNAASR